MRVLRPYLRPRVLVTVAVVLALLAGLLAFGNVSQMVKLLAGFHPAALAIFFAVMVAFEAMRWVQWHFMLVSLGIRVPRRTEIFVYMTGEVTKDLPGGIFFPDYLLKRSQGTDFGLASSATMLMTILEVAISLTGLLILGIDAWPWLRPLILVGSFAFLLVVWTLYRWHHHPHQHRPHPRLLALLRHRLVRKSLDELSQFGQGEATLLHPHVLTIGSLFSATYLALGGLGLYVIIAGLGIPRVSVWQALAAYFFTVVFAAIIPLPMDFGSTEVSGTGALLAMGVARSGAVASVLIQRGLNLLCTLIIAAVTFLVLHDELRAALAVRGEHAIRPTTATAYTTDPLTGDERESAALDV